MINRPHVYIVCSQFSCLTMKVFSRKVTEFTNKYTKLVREVGEIYNFSREHFHS